jgi:hypothetical protein
VAAPWIIDDRLWAVIEPLLPVSRQMPRSAELGSARIAVLFGLPDRRGRAGRRATLGGRSNLCPWLALAPCRMPSVRQRHSVHRGWMRHHPNRRFVRWKTPEDSVRRSKLILGTWGAPRRGVTVIVGGRPANPLIFTYSQRRRDTPLTELRPMRDCAMPPHRVPSVHVS